MRYKKPDGKWSWLGLGGYPEVSGAFARQKAAELRSDAAEGKNPIAAKKARKAAEVAATNETFEALAREWHTSRLAGWDVGTAKRVLGALERHVFPLVGKRPYVSIMSMEWMELLRGLERQEILEQMSRVRAYCKDIYDLARVTGRAMNNPLEGGHKFLSSGKAENYAHVSLEELPALIAVPWSKRSNQASQRYRFSDGAKAPWLRRTTDWTWLASYCKHRTQRARFSSGPH